MHDAVHGLRGERRAAIVRDAASGSELADAAEHLKTRVQHDRKNFGGGLVIGYVFDRATDGQIAVALEITSRDGLLLNVIRIADGEVASPIVEALAELRAAGERFQLAR